VHAKQKLSPSHYRGLALPLLAFLSACSPIPIRANSLEDAARNLARKICAAPRQQSVRINWQASPELSGSIFDSLKKAFLSQLSACGMATDKNSDSPPLNIAIQVAVSKVVLVASLADPGGSPQIRMTEIRRDTLSIANESSLTPRIQRKLLWQQERPLETAMEWYDPSAREHFLFLVNRGSFVRLRSTKEVWTEVDSAELPKADRPSRLGGGGATFVPNTAEARQRVVVNRKLCDFEPVGRLSFTCNDSYLGGKQLRISSECGGMPSWSLSTDTGDYTQRDRIISSSSEVAEAELPADEATSHSIEMPGPVLDISATEDSKAAIAVVRNLSTGNYEVYRITLACGN
jgi:hypothetical protein